MYAAKFNANSLHDNVLCAKFTFCPEGGATGKLRFSTIKEKNIFSQLSVEQQQTRILLMDL